jgi:hypothetical protein
MLDGGHLGPVGELFKFFLEMYVVMYVRVDHALEVLGCGLEYLFRNECEAPFLL